MNSNWISFDDEMPSPAYDSSNPGPTHGRILVTNNLSARNSCGKMSHIWLTSGVFRYTKEQRCGGKILAYEGEVTAYADPDEYTRIRNLTHWRPAVPEEWPDRGEAITLAELLRRADIK